MTNSTVVLERCTLSGSRANYETSRTSSNAGVFNGSDVRSVDCVFRGGDAHVRFGAPALPGTAAVRASGGTFRMTGAPSLIVAGSFSPEPAVVMGSGQLILEPSMNPTMSLGGAVLRREVRPTVTATNVGAGQVAALRLAATTGTLGAMVVGFPADRIALPGWVGDVWIDPTTACVAALGPPAGLSWNVIVPAVWSIPSQFRWQGAVFDGGVVTFTDPGAALLH